MGFFRAKSVGTEILLRNRRRVAHLGPATGDIQQSASVTIADARKMLAHGRLWDKSCEPMSRSMPTTTAKRWPSR